MIESMVWRRFIVCWWVKVPLCFSKERFPWLPTMDVKNETAEFEKMKFQIPSTNDVVLKISRQNACLLVDYHNGVFGCRWYPQNNCQTTRLAFVSIVNSEIDDIVANIIERGHLAITNQRWWKREIVKRELLHTIAEPYRKKTKYCTCCITAADQ